MGKEILELDREYWNLNTSTEEASGAERRGLQSEYSHCGSLLVHC
jgi:hypothetical protein